MDSIKYQNKIRKLKTKQKHYFFFSAVNIKLFQIFLNSILKYPIKHQNLFYLLFVLSLKIYKTLNSYFSLSKNLFINNRLLFFQRKNYISVLVSNFIFSKIYKKGSIFLVFNRLICLVIETKLIFSKITSKNHSNLLNFKIYFFLPL